MTKHRHKILKLQKECAQQEAIINNLTRENDDLRARLAGLLLLWRTSREIQRHRSELSPDDQRWHAELESQMQILEEQIVGAQLDLQQGREEGGGGGGWAGPSSAGRGWQGIGASSLAAVPPLGEFPGDDVLLSMLPHLALLEGGILRLGGVTAEEVQQARSDTMETVFARWTTLVEEAQQAMAATDSEGAAALLWAAGLRMTHILVVMAIWALPLYLQGITHHLITREPTVGLQDAPLQHWEAVVAAVRCTRWQALVLVELLRLQRSKLQQFAEAHAQLAAQLSATESAAGAGGPSAAALAYRGEQSEERDEVVCAMEAQLRVEEQTRVVFAVATCAVLTPAQLARAF